MFGLGNLNLGRMGNAVRRSKPPVVGDQAISFGALTASGAGGIIPTHTGSITSASITSGDASDHWDISASGVITPTAAGATADLNLGPYTLGVSFNGGVDTATVTVNVTASAYSVGTMVEAKAAANAIGAGGGVSILCRSGYYVADGDFMKNRAFSSAVTITPHTGASPVFQAINVTNSNNVTIDGLGFYREASGILNTIRNGSTNIVVQNCTFYGPTISPTGDYTGAQPTEITGIGKDGTTPAANVSILNNHMHDLHGGIALFCTGAFRVEGNYIHDIYDDLLKISYDAGTTSVNVSDNVLVGIIANDTDAGGPHPDFMQFVGISSSADWENITIDRNILVAKYVRAFAQGIFCDDMETGFYYSGIKIRGNLLINRGFASVGIRVLMAKNAEIVGNTVVSTSLLTGTGPGIVIGELTTNGTHVITNNAADSYSIAGSPTLTNNITLGSAGATIAYATAFDGPTFGPTTAAEAKTFFNMKAAGPLDLAVDVGSVGSGYVTWATTSPGNDGSLNEGSEFAIPGAFINASIGSEWMASTGAYINE